MEWPQERTLQLIELYKQTNVLWDPKNTSYFNKQIKIEAWDEIARELEKPVDDCRRKMEYLLSALRREKMKMKKSKGKGKDEGYRTSWFAFDSLKFLLDRKNPHQTVITENNDITTPEEVLEVQMETAEVPVESRYKDTPMVPKKKKKRIHEEISYDKHNQVGFVTHITSNNDNNEDCQHFGNMIAAKLRKYTEEVRTHLQNEIISLFVKANTGYYSTQYNYPANRPVFTHPFNILTPEHVNPISSNTHHPQTTEAQSYDYNSKIHNPVSDPTCNDVQGSYSPARAVRRTSSSDSNSEEEFKYADLI
ncbi:uncharacterized protein LOC142327660 [Lycorma delicatula]|uniref:uncharacterized protein LOC142327660 n=1 Tax=Lycorma delicatula TaxID=130591 RepID=UPI003F5102B5